MKRGAIPVEEALGIARQIAEALEAAHDKGIIHRDLKPANIKLTDEGVVKVLDFGLAKALGEETLDSSDSHSPTMSRAATQAGVLLGTAGYMSPEQARGRKADKRADVWAFGVVLFEMLTGGRLFAGETVSDTLAGILKVEPDWEKLPKETPWLVKRLLRRSLEKAPKNRIHDMADVRLDIEEALSTDELTIGPAGSDASGTRFGLLAITSVGLVATVLASLIWWSQWPTGPTGETSSARFVIHPPSTDATMSRVFNPQISPDGARIVYVRTPIGDGLMLQELDEFVSRILPGTEGAGTPFFSPDGQSIGFYADGKMKKVSVAGGHPSVVCDSGDLPPAGAAWGPDGSIVFSPSSRGFSQVSATGGDPVELTTPDKDRGESGHWWPKFLPDGKSLLFTVVTGTGLNESKVAILDLQTREHHYLLDGAQAHYAPSGHLIYYRTGSYYAVPFDLSGLRVTGAETPVLTDLGSLDPQGSYDDFYFSFSNNGTLVYVPGGSFITEKRLAWVSRDGRVEPLPFEPARFSSGELSPDRRRLAVTQFEAGELDIWIYDLERETKEKLTRDGQNLGPVWHPDGRRLAFQSMLTGSLDVRWSSLDGSLVEQSLVSTEQDEGPVFWSPDGLSLVFYQDAGIERALWSLEVGNSEGKPALVSTSVDELARPSPDGRWIAYSSDGVFYVARYPEITDRVSIASGQGPMWSHSTPELFFWSGGDLIAVRYDVVSGSFEPGQPYPVLKGLGIGFWSTFGISPDSQKFLVALPTEESQQPQLNVVLNWFEELKQLVPAEKN